MFDRLFLRQWPVHTFVSCLNDACTHEKPESEGGLALKDLCPLVLIHCLRKNRVRTMITTVKSSSPPAKLSFRNPRLFTADYMPINARIPV